MQEDSSHVTILLYIQNKNQDQVWSSLINAAGCDHL